MSGRQFWGLLIWEVYCHESCQILQNKTWTVKSTRETEEVNFLQTPKKVPSSRRQGGLCSAWSGERECGMVVHSFYVWENKTSLKVKSISESSDLNYRWCVCTCTSQFIINELQIRKRKNISSWVIACKFSDGGMLQCLCQSLWSATIIWRHKLVPKSDPARVHWWTNLQQTQWTFAQPA